MKTSNPEIVVLFEEKEGVLTKTKVLRENSKKSSYKHSFRNS